MELWQWGRSYGSLVNIGQKGQTGSKREEMTNIEKTQVGGLEKGRMRDNVHQAYKENSGVKISSSDFST